jgi:hypothetical protein
LVGREVHCDTGQRSRTRVEQSTTQSKVCRAGGAAIAADPHSSRCAGTAGTAIAAGSSTAKSTRAPEAAFSAVGLVGRERACGRRFGRFLSLEGDCSEGIVKHPAAVPLTGKSALATLAAEALACLAADTAPVATVAGESVAAGSA